VSPIANAGQLWTTAVVKRRLALLLVSAAAAFGAAGANAAQLLAVPHAIAKSCSSGYTHAVIGGVQKCLHAGEFCAHRYDSQYRRYGYRCIRFYANVGRYRLTRV
jgi:hypothetical protein